MDIEIDNLTLLLLLLLAGLLVYQRFFQPSPLVHSLQLGGQAAPAQVRQPGESPTYRSWATGQGTPVSSVVCSVESPWLHNSFLCGRGA